MARVKVTIPDEPVDQARQQRLNVSRLAAGAVAHELDRLRKIAQLEVDLADLDAALGPIPASAMVAAGEWADRVLAGAPTISPA